MPVTGDHVAILRAQLAGNGEEHQRLLKNLNPDADRLAYSALISAAFFDAVERRFTSDTTSAEVVDYVANLRTEAKVMTRDLPADAAERIIQHVIGNATISDLDQRTAFRTRILLLGALISDAQLKEYELERFLEKACVDANRILQ